MLLNDTAERRKFVATEAPRLRQSNRLQPKFGVLLRMFEGGWQSPLCVALERRLATIEN